MMLDAVKGTVAVLIAQRLTNGVAAPVAAGLASLLPITLGLDGIRQILYGKAAQGLLPLAWIPPLQVLLLAIFLFLAHRSLELMENLGKREGRLTLRGG